MAVCIIRMLPHGMAMGIICFLKQCKIIYHTLPVSRVNMFN